MKENRFVKEYCSDSIYISSPFLIKSYYIGYLNNAINSIGISMNSIEFSIDELKKIVSEYEEFNVWLNSNNIK